MRRADRIAWWIELVVVIGAILMMLGGVLALVRPAMLVGAVEMTAAARVFAGYFVARNLAIGTFLFGALFLRRRDALATLLLLASAVQAADVVLDVVEGRWQIVPGVLVLGVLFALAAMRLRRSSAVAGVTSYS